MKHLLTIINNDDSNFHKKYYIIERQIAYDKRIKTAFYLSTNESHDLV